MDYLEQYYANFNEDGRLLSKSGQVEYLTTMRYIHHYLSNNLSSRILEIGAGTGRYCIELAREGYSVDAIELTEYNLNVLRSKLTGIHNLTVHKGNSLDLSLYPDNTFDVTLILGPLYHLPDSNDKKQTLREAVRVTKSSGIIMAAYCMNDPVIIQEGFMRGNKFLQKPGTELTEDYHCISKAEEVFSVVRLEEIYELSDTLSIKRLKTIAADGFTNFICGYIEAMGDDDFARWLQYHWHICERQDLIGISNHVLDILQKK